MGPSFRCELAMEMFIAPHSRDREHTQVDRRRHQRFGIVVPVEYSLRDCRGSAVTSDMSSRGIFIKTRQILPVGKRVRLLIDWPVELDGGIPLRLFVVGRVLRSSRRGTAVSVLQHEYRIRPKILEEA